MPVQQSEGHKQSKCTQHVVKEWLITLCFDFIPWHFTKCSVNGPQAHLTGILRKHPRRCNEVSCTQRAAEQRLPAGRCCKRPAQGWSKDDYAHCSTTHLDIKAWYKM